MTKIPDAVADWATDFDHTHPDYNENAHEIWDTLREQCPVAHSDRFGGVWLPTRHQDVAAVAYDTENYSSQGVIVSPVKPADPPPLGPAPPITADPPAHKEARRILLPAFSPKRIASWESTTRDLCRRLIAELPIVDGKVDAAVNYTQHIPVGVIAAMLGVPESDGELFRHHLRLILENPGSGEDLPEEETLFYYLDRIIGEHRDNPKDNLISYLLDTEFMGEPLSDNHIVGTVLLLLVAGIDTTWSAIGSSIWHLATNPDDRQRLVDEPELLPVAVEEFLRAYAPVTMARLASTDHELNGCPVKQGDWMLLPFPAANRDPEQFEDADKVIIDRAKNRHSAFGLGIHRCLGSNLARLEMKIALEEWLKAFPNFWLDEEAVMRWSTGQVRGPRQLPVVIG